MSASRSSGRGTSRVFAARPRRGWLPGGRRPRLVTATRAGALLGLIASAGLGYGAVTSSAFDLLTTDVGQLRWTDRAAVLAAATVPVGTNVFRISTTPLEERIRALPAVAAAHVHVALPDRLVVDVVERTPILAWRIHDDRYLVDRDGRVFATATEEAVASAGIPTIDDTRTESATTIGVGVDLDPEDLDAAARLCSLVPADVGSVAERLAVSVSDANGFVVGTSPPAWTAIFGFYTPSVRTTALIPGQVRLLRSLLFGREGSVERVILADDRNGTYVPRSTGSPAP